MDKRPNAKHITMKKLLLGSNSPRRKELLSQMGYDFSCVSIDCEENFPSEIPCHEVAQYLAELKSKAYLPLQENELLITADTVVVHENTIFGKPNTFAEAQQMLQKLSGNTHQVYTAICLRTLDEMRTFSDMAEVSVLPLTEKEIESYIQNGKPMDKAGSYGIQDWFGLAKISHIKGNYYTIMGLPTHILYRELKKNF